MAQDRGGTGTHKAPKTPLFMKSAKAKPKGSNSAYNPDNFKRKVPTANRDMFIRNDNDGGGRRSSRRTGHASDGGNFSDTYGGYDGGGDISSFSAPEPEISEEDYLAGDASYLAQIAALKKAMEDYSADSGAQKSKYETDYGDTLRNLGWTPDNAETADVDEAAWNLTDQNTSAGRAFTNQQNDFAGRGLLQSSLYGTANDNLTRSLNDQLGGINSSKQTFMDDLARQLSAFTSDNTLSTQQAKAEALARRAAGVTI